MERSWLKLIDCSFCCCNPDAITKAEVNKNTNQAKQCSRCEVNMYIENVKSQSHIKGETRCLLCCQWLHCECRLVRINAIPVANLIKRHLTLASPSSRVAVAASSTLDSNLAQTITNRAITMAYQSTRPPPIKIAHNKRANIQKQYTEKKGKLFKSIAFI